MSSHHSSFGYFHVTISASFSGHVLKSNNERAFVVAQLQDLLSPRLLLGEVPAHKQLASCIDLLTFSIRRETIQLIIFSIDTSLSEYFTRCIASRFQQYQNELRPRTPPAQVRPLRTSVQKLTGPHHALQLSSVLHLLHEDWEYDRYSSIGFYLHDRRGDWMRTWRLAQLYENNPAQYRHFLCGPLSNADQSSRSPLSGALNQLPAS